MRLAILILALVVGFGCNACSMLKRGAASTALAAGNTQAPKPVSSGATPGKIDFTTQIRPILKARCQPCHFSGGKVYARMPFDRQETIKSLGTKLFTRIKDQKEQQLIREFLAQ